MAAFVHFFVSANSAFLQFYIVLGDIIISLTIGAFWTLAFESPMITIERIIFGRVATPKEQRKENPASPSVANARDLSNETQISINEKNDVAEDNTTQHTR